MTAANIRKDHAISYIFFIANLLTAPFSVSAVGFEVLEPEDADLSAFCIALLREEPIFSWDMMETEAVIRFGGEVRRLEIPTSWGDREELVEDDNGQIFAQTSFVVGGFDDTLWIGDAGLMGFQELAPTEEVAREEADSQQIYYMTMVGQFSGHTDSVDVRIECGL